MTSDSNKSHITSEIKSLLFIVGIALMVRMFVLELFFVPTSSMKATIMEGDYIFSTKYSYGFSRYSIIFDPNIFSGRIFASKPERGDVVIFRPPHLMHIRFIKRLIGLPGDIIEIIDNVIYINNKPTERIFVGYFIDEQGKQYKQYKERLPDNGVSYYSYKLKENEKNVDTDNFGPYYVPEGKYFFLGDNRDESGDSRFALGFVPFENFISKARIVVLSTKEIFWIDNISILDRFKRIWVWLSSIRFNRSFRATMTITHDNE